MTGSGTCLIARDCYDDCIAFLDEELGVCSISFRLRGFLTTRT